MGVASITALLNVRVDKADKEQFVSTASELGISPLLRHQHICQKVQ